jgi:hypothetical protein
MGGEIMDVGVMTIRVDASSAVRELRELRKEIDRMPVPLSRDDAEFLRGIARHFGEGKKRTRLLEIAARMESPYK